MLTDATIFIGVDPCGGRKPYTCAVLDQNGRLVDLKDGELQDTLDFIGGQAGAIVAVNGPPRPNKGLIRQENIRQDLPPLHISGRSLDMRLVEHQLRERGINVAMTPSRKEFCANWVQTGFEFYRQLQDLGYVAYPATEAAHQWIETHPHAIFCVLLEQIPLARTSLEGRLQRQLILYEQGLEIRDPMEFFEEITSHKLMKGILPLEQIYSSEELDAIAAAYVAYVAGCHPERVIGVGDGQEGQILLPVKELKTKY